MILLKTMELAADSPNDLYFVFTVQEEVGLCGAHTAAHGIVPDYGIAVDVTCTDDVPGSRHTVSAALGKGAGIKVMDGSLMCHGAVVERLKELAAGNGIPAQPDLMSAGGTDAGPMHISHDGVLAGGISIRAGESILRWRWRILGMWTHASAWLLPSRPAGWNSP